MVMPWPIQWARYIPCLVLEDPASPLGSGGKDLLPWVSSDAGQKSLQGPPAPLGPFRARLG